ncbi:MAG: class I SAM-dependent methyltransferase [Campylobacterota bacterium]|nr:class I SAM-dependent methyltransferase [Campylobacterota bacterium]
MIKFYLDSDLITNKFNFKEITMNEKDYNFPNTGIHKYVAEYIRTLPDMSGKTVLDIPCGDGRSSYEFMKKGANVIALDLFPEFMLIDDITAQYADLSEKLPIEDNSVDYIMCQEGIEHIPDQMNVFEEFNRVLKKDGILLMTTPNYSHMRARLSHLLLETDLWKRMPPTEIDTIWFAENNKDKLYFGHLFLVGVQHLQSLVTFTGFKVTNRIKTDKGNTSILLGILSYPFLLLFTMLSYFSYRKKNTQIDQETRRDILWKRVKLNLSPTTLFYKHIFWEMKKANSLDETINKLREMQRKK